jgi:hypothetical protein
VPTHVVDRVPVLEDGRPAGCDLGEATGEIRGVAAIDQVVEVRVPVEVVEVFEQREVQLA